MQITRIVIFFMAFIFVSGCSFIPLQIQEKKSNQVSVPKYNQETLSNYIDNIKQASEFIAGIKSPDSKVSKFFKTVWAGVTGPVLAKIKMAKLEIQDWPADARQIGWNTMGKSIEPKSCNRKTF